jgi:hypothetical protein
MRAERFGLSLGYWLPWNDLHYVLFLRRLGNNLYQRAGVGVLFGKDVEREFHLADESEIALVWAVFDSQGKPGIWRLKYADREPSVPCRWTST